MNQLFYAILGKMSNKFSSNKEEINFTLSNNSAFLSLKETANKVCVNFC